MTQIEANSGSTDADVIVAGTGPVGLVAALAFAASGYRTALIGPDPVHEDRRTTAIMTPGLAFLDALGIADRLKAQGAPLRAMRIIDGTRRLVRGSPVLFRASEVDEDAFGWNIPNRHLLDTLDGAARSAPGVVRFPSLIAGWSLGGDAATARLEDGEKVRAPLVVAADGRDSPAREAAGIAVRIRRLPQNALVASFSHGRPHDFISNEIHTEHGPFTQVPLPGDRSSLVWVSAPAEAERLKALPDAEFSEAVEERMQSMLGRVAVEPGRQLFALTSVTPRTYADRRVALVGEAAHTIPPIGAQGLNLGLGDVRDLLEAANANRPDIGAAAALGAYRGARALAIATRGGAVNLLNDSLLADSLLVQVARGMGLSALRNVGPLRAFFMREGLQAGGRLGRRPRRSARS